MLLSYAMLPNDKDECVGKIFGKIGDRRTLFANLGVVKINLTESIVATLRVTMKGGGEQISYERSSQAQSLTCPPISLSAAG